MANSSYHEVLQRASSFLKAKGKEEQAAKYVLLGRLDWDLTQWLLQMNNPMPEACYQRFQQDIQLLLTDYPPQYILGWCEFYGARYTVTEATLIPRPETEELVEACLKANQVDSLNVLDIGTGSGIIAISLKRLRPTWVINATDISEKALAVAQINAKKHQTPITFRLGNLGEPFLSEKFDIILANLPYIGENEWTEMDRSVRTYEPKSALFAANQGLALFEELANQLPTLLKGTGQLFLEIGYQQGEKVREIVRKKYPEKEIQILKDLNGLDRIIWLK